MKINFTQMFVCAVFLMYMICGTQPLQAQIGIEINSPANIAGINTSISTAFFGPSLVDIGSITGNLVASDSLDGCTPFVNATAVMGNIALIDRETCDFDDKVANAEAAGAIAAIICMVDDGEPSNFFGDADSIMIPSFMITKALCDQIRMELPGVNITLGYVGCTSPNACNFTPLATIDEGLCFFSGDACDDGDAFTISDLYQTDCTCAGFYNPDLESACYEPNVGTDIASEEVTSGSALAVDLDGDGDNDLLATTSDDFIVWYENDGQGNFSSENAIDSVLAFINELNYGDLDGDGDNDVISGSFFDTKIFWYENDGQGNFGSQNIIIDNDGQPRSISAIDLDGDGDNDILSATGQDNLIAWYENDGQGNFGSQNVIDSISDVSDVYPSDFDGDGDNDVVSSSFDGIISWYENDGQGGFGTANTIVNNDPTNAVYAVYAADFEGDGDNDVLAVNNYAGRIVWYENDGQGSFGTANIITQSSGIASSPHITDIDGDGDNDVLSTFIGNDFNDTELFNLNAKTSLHENDGQGSFTESIIATYPLGSPATVDAADLDGDGDKEIIISDIGSFDGPFSDYVFFTGGVVWYENICNLTEQTTPTVSEEAIQITNYPNPFNSMTNIEFTLPVDQSVTLFVSDMVGRKVATLLNNELTSAGGHTITFEGYNYPAGMYYYTMQAGQYITTKKMMLMK